MNHILLFITISLVSYLLTGIIRQYAIKNNLYDVPNQRSSHKTPTPRGGGLAIVLTFIVIILYLTIFQDNIDSGYLYLLGAGLLIALVGFIDDHGHIAPHWRLLTHLVSSIWIMIWMGGFPPVVIFYSVIDLSWLGNVFAVLYIAWLLNLYNFMDGIDGVAGVEAITVCCGGVILFLLVDKNNNEWLVPLYLMAAVLGFLLWNVPKAKIFMGDVGSGFLGLMLGALSIQAAWIAPELFWSWLILLGVFMVDATVTLIRRIIRKEKFYEAHCSHAYQYASRQLNSHMRVTLSVGLINLIWLLPIAVLVAMQYLNGVIGLIIAYIPLIILAFHYKAGASEMQLVEIKR